MINNLGSTPPASGGGKRQTQLGKGPFDAPIVHSLYQLYHDWHELCLKFPKSERYSLGGTCQDYLLKALEAVIAAAGTNESDIKLQHLRTASYKIDMLKLLVRL